MAYRLSNSDINNSFHALQRQLVRLELKLLSIDSLTENESGGAEEKFKFEYLGISRVNAFSRISDPSEFHCRESLFFERILQNK